ncbi:hypothetical protein [Mesorhizobium sp.]|uniref:hypothetical protein n=1 Tax=Mesorhizobium sp. TaxID=1871066 RepID=UPI000FE84C53|nr:hypothetical protein [Mesorhizobium sp.]RWE35002.1 MAG: hypothetical protein EOS77_08495 [Mesorhizobium sp.]
MTYNLPAVRWLAKKDPDAALAVLQRIRDTTCTYGAEVEPGYLDPRDRNADDVETHAVPDAPATGETMVEPVQDGADEIHPEMLHEVKPGLHEMLRSAGGLAWPWCGQRVKRRGKVKWVGEPWGYFYCLIPHFTEEHVTALGDLTFYTRPGARRGFDGGLLVTYIDAHGTLQKPFYRAAKPRGGKKPHRTKEAAQAYLNLPRAVAGPMDAQTYQRPMSGEPALPPMLIPTEACAASKAELAAAYANTPVLPPVTYCPTGLPWKGLRFIAGISGRSQTASPGVIGKVEESARQDASVEKIIEEVAARGTLQSIGTRLGYNIGYADRAGGKALLEAGKAIMAANDTNRQKLAA